MIARLYKSEGVRHGAFVFGAVVISSLFNFLYYMLIARVGGVTIYGVVTALTSAMLVVLVPAQIGQLIAARLAADLAARNDDGALRSLADFLTTWTTSVAAVIVALGILFRGAIAAFFNLSDSVPVVMVTISLGVYAVVMVQRGVLQGSHRFGDYSVSTSIDAVVKVIVGVPLVATLGATGGLIGLVAAVVLALLYDLYAFRVRLGTTRSPIALDRALIARVVSHVGLGQLTFTVLTFYDVPLIKHAFDAHSAGLYAATALVGRSVLTAVSFIPTLIMPKASARLAEGRSTLSLLGAALGLSGFIVGIALLLALVAPRFVVTLLSGKAFADAAPLVLSYTVAAGALALANVIAAYKMGLHRYDFVIPCLLAAAAEVTVFSVLHPTLTAAVTVLMIGHVAVLAATLYRVVRNEKSSASNVRFGL